MVDTYGSESAAPPRLTRWGIAGAGRISNDFVISVGTFPKDERHVVVAVAARDSNRAKQFAATHNILRAYGSYDDLATDKDIDVIYVGVINSQHFAVAKLMINNGKPVLCERPLTTNYKDTKQLVDLARSKKIFLMEGLFSRFLPIYDEMRKELTSGSLGNIVQIHVSFGVDCMQEDRIRKKELGGGSTLNMAPDALQLVLCALGGNAPRPRNVVALGHITKEGVDSDMGCVLAYDAGAGGPQPLLVLLATHCNTKLQNDATIVGTRGVLRVDEPFICPPKLSVNGEDKATALPPLEAAGGGAPGGGSLNYPHSSLGLRYEAREVRRCLLEGLKESPKMKLADSLIIAEIIDTLLIKTGYIK